MGQKVHPIGMRLGIVQEHNSIWYADSKDYAGMLHKDIRIRDFIRTQLADAWVSRIKIDRSVDSVVVTIYTARPGIVIGKKGEGVEKLRYAVSRITGVAAQVKIEEIRTPEIDALLVAEQIAQQLERRVQFRRAMRRAIQSALRSKAEGIKVRVAGRLGGVDIARSEVYHEGRVPLHTLRANIDYGTAEAKTTYGVIGIKVWIFKGEIIGKKEPTVPSGVIVPLSSAE